MMLTKRDGLETLLILLAVVGTLAIAAIVVAVKIGFVEF